MDIFGKLFDFDHDGEVSSSEAMMGLGGAALIAGMAEEQERAQREQELRDRLETLVDEINAHSDESGFHVELEDSLEGDAGGFPGTSGRNRGTGAGGHVQRCL